MRRGVKVLSPARCTTATLQDAALLMEMMPMKGKFSPRNAYFEYHNDTIDRKFSHKNRGNQAHGSFSVSTTVYVKKLV
jgi:hypothetical protein